jgi:hypothetical protein
LVRQQLWLWFWAIVIIGPGSWLAFANGFKRLEKESDSLRPTDHQLKGHWPLWVYINRPSPPKTLGFNYKGIRVTKEPGHTKQGTSPLLKSEP